jgi:hypothetical protein
VPFAVAAPKFLWCGRARFEFSRRYPGVAEERSYFSEVVAPTSTPSTSPWQKTSTWVDLQISAADTLKRVLAPVSGVQAASLDRIVAFTETVWHTKSLL